MCWATAAPHADSFAGRQASQFGCVVCGSSDDEFISGQMLVVSPLLLGGVPHEVSSVYEIHRNRLITVVLQWLFFDDRTHNREIYNHVLGDVKTITCTSCLGRSSSRVILLNSDSPHCNRFTRRHRATLWKTNHTSQTCGCPVIVIYLYITVTAKSN